MLAVPSVPSSSPVVALERAPDHAALAPSVASPSPVSAGVRDRLGALAAQVPGYTLLTFVLGFDPVTGRLVVPRRRGAAAGGGGAGARWRGALPGALAARGDRAVGAWVREQLGSAGVDAASVRRMLDAFFGSLGLGDLLHLGAVVERARRLLASVASHACRWARRCARASFVCCGARCCARWFGWRRGRGATTCCVWRWRRTR